MRTVKQILETKGNDVWSVAPDTHVFTALELMAEKNVGALLVVQNGAVAGIFSERDYARKVALEGKSSREIPVSEIMTREVITVTPEDRVEECMTLMTAHHIRHLPVLDGGQLAGIISIGDVVNAIISEQEFLIDQLEGYIKGSRPTRGAHG